MFTIRKDRKVWWPVIINEPRDDGSGETEEVTFEAQISLLKRSDWKRLENQRSDRKQDKIAEQILLDHIHNWRNGPVNEAGDQVPFSRDTLQSLLDDPLVIGALVNALIRASSGLAARGNSKAG